MIEPNVYPKFESYSFAEPGLPEECQLVDYFTELLGLKRARIEAHHISAKRCGFRRSKKHYNQKEKK